MVLEKSDVNLLELKLITKQQTKEHKIKVNATNFKCLNIKKTLPGFYKSCFLDFFFFF